jgi:NAD(P)-dependent dehydrogenase (short-subunit alcohol dehydrogenase family)
MNLINKIALVTGGSRGLGRNIALTLPAMAQTSFSPIDNARRSLL